MRSFRTLSRFFVLSGGLLGALLLFASNGAAEAVPKTPSFAPSATRIVPPRLESSSRVAYPSNAHGNAVVMLVLAINADGTVRNARALAGNEPFASAALDAVRTWRFEPALRNGRRTAVLIRFAVSFLASRDDRQETLSRTSPTDTRLANSHAADNAAEAIAPPPEPIEVVVTGQRSAPAVSSLSRSEVRQLPGAFGDPFRAVEALPGVTPIASGLPFFYVRGAPPGNVGYFLDGVRVPYLYHVGLGPSVVHPALVERVDLYLGGYPARFGGFAGGIVSGETTAPRTDWHAEGNLRLFDAGAMLETGFANGRGTVLLGGRYSYTAAIFSLLVRDTVLDYRDYQARASYDISAKDRVSVFSFGSYDLFGERKADRLNILFGSEFYRVDLRYDHSFGTASTVRYAVTLGYDQTRIAEQRNVSARSVGTRVELRHVLSDDVVFRAGADTMLDAYGASNLRYDDPEDPEVQKRNALFPKRNDVAAGGWVDIVLKVTQSIEVVPGVRVGLFTSRDAAVVGVDPRIAARFKVSNKVRILHAYGVARTNQEPWT
jgi:TonB family protein